MKDYSSASLDEVALPTVMQALSDPGRIAILQALLENGELACNEIPLKVAKATVSHHFAILREAGLLQTRTSGTKCLSSIPMDAVESHFPGLLALVKNSGMGTI
jgi:DNA-binding transcriptional ArsR family regulator